MTMEAASSSAGRSERKPKKRIFDRVPDCDDEPEEARRPQVESGDVGEENGEPKRDNDPQPDGVAKIAQAVGGLGSEEEFLAARGCGLGCACDGHAALLAGV
jgi:hypothetical protein